MLCCVPPAAAQISVEVSPLRVELQAGPGSTTTQAVTLTNAGSEPVRVRARLSDWDLSRDGAPQFESARTDGPFSATRWLRLAPPEITVAPGQEALVRFSLTIPGDTPQGSYRAGILFEFAPEGGDRVAVSREVAFRSRVATLIYVGVGHAPLDAELLDLHHRVRGGETLMVAVLKNTSRRSTRTRGTLALFDEGGVLVRQTHVPDVPLLPESERELAIVVAGGERQPPLAPGTYRVELRLDLGLPAVLVGETTLKVPR
jgi:hypothetical protein